MSKVVNVILSGGVGSRLWPLSRKSKPKQYIELINGMSLFELSVERNASLVDSTLIVGNEDNIALACESIDKLGVESNFVVESIAKNTAPAIAFAAFFLEADDIMFVSPCDHVIEDGEDKYADRVKDAVQLAKQGNVVTFGISPTRPDTGFGYIEHEGNNVISFHEKPNKLKAHEFIKKGSFLWNSGMFCFKAGVFLEELKQYRPDIYEGCALAYEKSEENDGKIHMNEEYSERIPEESIDYAVMEQSKSIKTVPSSFFWSDLGSFESLYDFLRSKGKDVDENGNMTLGCDKHVSFVGIENSLYVNTKDAVLIVNKNNAQEVKQIYKYLEKSNSSLI